MPKTLRGLFCGVAFAGLGLAFVTIIAAAAAASSSPPSDASAAQTSGYPERPCAFDGCSTSPGSGVKSAGTATSVPNGAQPTVTPTPVAPEPASVCCATPYSGPTCPSDYDCDAFANPQTSNTCGAPKFCPEGPVNTNHAEDDCPVRPDGPQKNSDSNFIALPHPRFGTGVDDKTRPNSDNVGDECDYDIDNDNLIDLYEILSGPGGECPHTSAPLKVDELDSDRDGITDDVECTRVFTNPMSSASVPSATTCATAFGVTVAQDTDGDGVKDYVELCSYNTSPTNINSDGDGCGDGREVASVNQDFSVTSADLSMVAGAFGGFTSPAYLIELDANKDRSITSADLAFVAGKFGNCP